MAAFLGLWIRAEQIRGRGPRKPGLPGSLSLFLGTAALGYLWSDSHRDAHDAKLTRIVFVARTAQVLLLLSVLSITILP